MKIKFLKYLIMSIAFGVLYGLINYWANKEIKIKELIITTFSYFIVLCLMAFLAPYLRKLFGFENKE